LFSIKKIGYVKKRISVYFFIIHIYKMKESR